MSDTVYAILFLAAFALFCWGTWWSICRECDRAQHEAELDLLWDSPEDDEVAA